MAQTIEKTNNEIKKKEAKNKKKVNIVESNGYNSPTSKMGSRQ